MEVDLIPVQDRCGCGCASLWVRNVLEEGQKAGKGHDHEITLADEEEYLLDRVGDFQHPLFWSHERAQSCVKEYGVDEGRIKLFSGFDPKNPAKAPMVIMEVLSPKKVKNVGGREGGGGRGLVERGGRLGRRVENFEN